MKRRREKPTPAIVRLGSTVYGGDLFWDPLATMGETFRYIDRQGRAAEVDGKFEVLARYNIGTRGVWVK